MVRANTAFEAVKHYAKQPFAVVIANIHLPDTSGWLMAAKLHFVDPTARIWLYESHPAHGDVAKAKFLQIDELIVYDGDLLGLALPVISRLASKLIGQEKSNRHQPEKHLTEEARAQEVPGHAGVPTIHVTRPHVPR